MIEQIVVNGSKKGKGGEGGLQVVSKVRLRI